MKQCTFLTVLFLIVFTLFVRGQNTSDQLLSSSMADTWVAKNAMGRKLVTDAQNGKIRKDRYVGIFYFIWHGAHGYDHIEKPDETEGVKEKKPTAIQSPYDITKILEQNPNNPQYGPLKAFHYWGEPYFGYYLPDDEWIINKHAQMLSDAGVDVIILDVTNSSIYLPQVTKSPLFTGKCGSRVYLLQILLLLSIAIQIKQ